MALGAAALGYTAHVQYAARAAGKPPHPAA
jgi:hypothetical protein